MKRILAIMLFSTGLLCPVCQAGEVGFIEDFALAGDRTVPLKQLVPGTEQYYYYHCLHYQNTGDLDRVDELLKTWIERYTNTSLIREIQNRQALLRYEKDPTASLAFLTRRLGVSFNHQRVIAGRKPTLPVALNERLIGREALTARALARHRGTLAGFEDRALDWLIVADLGSRRRNLLRRLSRPDYANLPKLVVDDLNEKRSGGFGSHKIHRQLLLAQLQECLKLKPDLLANATFVNTTIGKLAPDDDVDLEHDTEEREAHLTRLWGFVDRLSPAFNSLKGHVLYHRLVHDRALGVYDKGRFMTYIRLPRNVPYINRTYLRRGGNRRYQVSLQSDYRKVTKLPPIFRDEELVRSYLARFFVKEDSTAPYEPYIDKTWLKRVLAETKIVNGLGDMERWYSLLPPAKHQVLKECVDLDFAYTNKTVFDRDEDVKLDLHVKNVKTLIIKVYDINTMNYYQREGKEVGMDVNLDGLVANKEYVKRYQDPPFLRKRRTFTFPELKKPGVYVVEFIGSDRRSRALIRKGKLRFLTRTSTAGFVFTILDERNRKLKDASLWLSGHQYLPEEDGTVTVPFTEAPGRQSIILQQGPFASLGHFSHDTERYGFNVGVYVDREALLKQSKATVIVRPVLTLNNTPVTLSVLKDVRLIITSEDRDGISTTKEVADFALHEDRESTYEFAVPDRLAGITFVLKAKVRSLSRNKDENLSGGAYFTLNAIDRTEKVEDLHLSHVNGRYVLDVMGKTGEPRTNRPVHCELKHRDFKDVVKVSLQTDEEVGRIALGTLKDIDWISVKGPEGTKRTWHLDVDSHSMPSVVHGRVGEAVVLPYMGGRKRPVREELSLIEKRGNTFVVDRFDALKVKGGFIVIDGLPKGDYQLVLKDEGRVVTIRLSAGRTDEGYVLSGNRQLQVLNPTPLQIVGIDANDNEVKIKLANAGRFARVHVAATRFMPEYSIAGRLGQVGFPEPTMIELARLKSLYQAGRKLGDEYRYILERKYARKFPGNMLNRPGLLLNPWELSKTETATSRVRPGEGLYGRGKGGGRRASGRDVQQYLRRSRRAGEVESNLDFLGESSVVLTNLRPDRNGVVTIKRAELGAHQQLHVVAMDPMNTVYRELSLPEVPMKFRNLWLVEGLDPAKHFTQQKKVSILKAKDSLVLPDVLSSRLELYDTLPKVYRLYATLSGNATLAEFNWILEWPKMTADEKREKYSKYACHELHFFLSRKDPAFFLGVVRPYLANKKDKTFLDEWLLGRNGEALAGYVEPWRFAQLNIVERVLLARRIQGEPKRMARHVKDLFDIIPPDVERFNRLFETALKGSALDAGVMPVIAAAPMPMREPGRITEAFKMRSLAETEAKSQGARKSGALDAEADDGAFYAADKKRRRAVRALYRKLEKTKELVENNYYHVPIEGMNADLVKVNAFWNDYAAHDGKGPFFSEHLAQASGNFTEMMFALSVLDIPYEAAEHKVKTDERRLTLKAAGPMVVFHEEVKEARQAEGVSKILVSQNFFKRSDRYTFVDNERLDKFVTDEFIVHTVYGCQVVVTNPTSSPQKLDVLLQIPRGAIPVLNTHTTRSVHIDLPPYRTWTHEVHFYFPAVGEFAHYPVQVARNEKLIGFAEAVTLNVVQQPSSVDTTSWDYISQRGTEAEVIAYLTHQNLNRIRLARIAWRMSNGRYFTRVINLLARRHVYDNTLWSYGLKHNEPAAVSEFLKHRDDFIRACGSYIDTKLLKIDPVVRKSYQHMEYDPLVNARAHRVGKSRSILNDRFHAQYQRLMKVLSYRSTLDDDDLMAVTYTLLLQDRVAEGLDFFARVNPKKLATSLQHDYFAAYLDFYTDDHKVARGIARRYRDYPVDRWRKLFANVEAHLDEWEQKDAVVVDPQDRTQLQTGLAATEPSFDFEVASRKITINTQNLTECVVNYYLMDIELLFSTNPFVQEYSGRFAYVRPSQTALVKLPRGKTTHTFDLPARFHSSNVMVEIVAGPLRKSQAYYAHELALQVIENYGQLKVTSRKTGRPLAKVYVKVYAMTRGEKVKFYKDGYTDLRGRFEYTSLSTDELDNVKKFSLLIMSEDTGAVVREAKPPKR